MLKFLAEIERFCIPWGPTEKRWFPRKLPSVHTGGERGTTVGSLGGAGDKDKKIELQKKAWEPLMWLYGNKKPLLLQSYVISTVTNKVYIWRMVIVSVSRHATAPEHGESSL